MSRHKSPPEVEVEDSDQDEYHDVESPGHSTGGRRNSVEEMDIKPPGDPADQDLGFNVVSSMSEEDLNHLINRLEAESPVIDTISVNLRARKLNWNSVAFDAYSAEECQAAWEYLKSLTRRFRIMSEVVREIKLITERDNAKFRAKLIESAPGFPRKPPNNGCQMFCREMWNMNPHKGNNFILFQRECHDKYNALPKGLQLDWEKKCDLLKADHNRQVKEFYANYPHYTAFIKSKKLGTFNRDAMNPTKRTAPRTKLSQDSISIMFSDAPPPPLTPQLEFIQSKLNRIDPPPQAEDLPELKKKYKEKWQKLSEHKKSKWIARTIKRSEEYVEEMEHFQERNAGFTPKKPFRLRTFVSKEELSIWEKYNDKPERPPNSVNEMFHQNMIQDPDYSELSREESRKVAEEQFKDLDNYNRELYKLNYKRAIIEYRKNIQAYFESLPEFLKPAVLPTIPKKFHGVLTSVDKVLEEFLIEEEENEIKDIETGTIDVEAESEAPPKKKKKKNKNLEDEDELKSEPTSPQKKQKTKNLEHLEEEEVKDEPLSPRKKKKKHNLEGNTTEESDAGPVVENGGSVSKVPRSMASRQQSESAAAPKTTEKAVYNRRTLRTPQLKDFPPNRVITKKEIDEIIRGIFDARQQIGRTYSVFYFYAKYVAREVVWIRKVDRLGLLETAGRIFKTFLELSKLQKMTFINESLVFYKNMDPAFWGRGNGHVKNNKKLLHPGEPEPPPKSAMDLYKAEMIPVKRRYPELHIPNWLDLDEKIQNLYIKKLFRNTKNYVKAYELFVMNMNPNDMVAYTTYNAQIWESHKLSTTTVRDAFRGFIFPLSRGELSEDENIEAEDSDPEVIDEATLKARQIARAKDRPEVHNVLNNDDLIATITRRVTVEDPTFEEVMEDTSSGSDNPTESENEQTSFKFGDPSSKLQVTAYVQRVKKLVKRRSRFLYDLNAIPDIVPEKEVPEPQPDGWTLKLLRKAQTTRGKNRIKRKYAFKDRIPPAAVTESETPEAQATEPQNHPEPVESPSYSHIDEAEMEVDVDPLASPNIPEEFPQLINVDQNRTDEPEFAELTNVEPNRLEEPDFVQLPSIELLNAGQDDAGAEQYFTVYHDLPIFDEAELDD